MTKAANGDGSTYQDGAGWVAALTVRRPDGTTQRLRKRASSQREARTLLRSWRQARESGVRLERREATVAELLAGFLDAVRDEVRPGTLGTYEWACRLYIAPVIGTMLARNVTPADVRTVLRGAGERVGPRSVQHVRKALSMAFTRAVHDGVVARNPVESVRGPQVARAEVEPFTIDEVGRLLDAVRGERLGALAVVGVTTGVRLSEALGLRWDSVDFEAGAITISEQLSKIAGAGFELVTTKTTAGRRTIGLPVFAVEALRAHRVRQLEERLALGGLWHNDLDLVFTTPTGAPLHRRNALRWFQDVLAREGLPVRGFKELRHTNATLLHDQGASLKDMQAALGHGDVKVTANVYTHLFAERKHTLATMVGTALGR